MTEYGENSTCDPALTITTGRTNEFCTPLTWYLSDEPEAEQDIVVTFRGRNVRRFRLVPIEDSKT